VIEDLIEKLDSLFRGFEGVFKTPTSILAISVLAGVCRTILTEDRRTFTGYIRGLFLAVFVGILVSNFLKDYAIGDGLRTAITIVAAFSADDFLFVVLRLTKMLRDDPAEVVKLILKALGLKKADK
jgi:hypothetical protein